MCYDLFQDFKDSFYSPGDCEGGEFSIFDDENLQILRKSDLIIEMHYKNYELQKKEFMSKFEHTHNLIVEKTNRPGGENYVEDYDFLKNIPVKFAKKFIGKNNFI